MRRKNTNIENKVSVLPLTDYLVRPDDTLIEVDAKFLEWKRSGHTIILHDGKQLPGSDVTEEVGKHPYDYQLGTIVAVPIYAKQQKDCLFKVGMRIAYKLNMSKRYLFDDELIILTNGGIWGIVEEKS